MTARTKQDDEKALQWALALHKGGRLAEARALYEEILRSQPRHFNATYYLAVSYAQQNNFDLAAKFFGKAARLNPGFADAYFNCGLAFHSSGVFQEAVKNYDRAIHLMPDLLDAHYNRGSALAELKRLPEALKSFERAIQLKPDYAEAYFYRGNVLSELSRHEEALQSFDRAIQLKPDYAQAHSNHANALKALNHFEEALQGYDRAIRLKPDYADAHYNRGIALGALKRFEEALRSCDRAIQIKPDYAEAYASRGVVLRELSRFEEALQNYERAFQLKPHYEFLLGEVLRTKMNICDWSDYSSNIAELRDRLSRGEKAAPPFVVLALLDSLGMQRKAAESWGGAKFTTSGASEERPSLPSHQRIRIGYFSTDFRDHATAFLTAGLFEQHDRSKFELMAFSLGPDTDDDMRMRLKGAFDKFIDVRNMSDRDVALLARGLEIDIGVDLNGFTGDARTSIFAMRAAPVQVIYLGYPGTTGADYIDYLIADPMLIPAAHRAHYTEKVVYLPNTYQPNDRERRISDKVFTRSELSLPQEGFIFCCFNNNHKTTPEVFDSWMRILGHVGGSVLWLLEDNEIAIGNLKKEASARGIDPDRLVFAPRMTLPDHLARHRKADLFLDTLPYNAHTTASDALWTGLPVLTQIGETFAGRVAASLLNAAGFPELITTTRDAYEALAIELATNPAKLASIRQKLSDNRLTTPLFDTALFTKHIESAYTAMYERQQAGLPPDHIHVPQ